MEKALETIIQEIEKKLKFRTDFIEFKIGKTDDLDERRDKYRSEGYYYLWEIGCGTSSDINMAEKTLIEYFRDESPYRKRCKNKNDGGGGNPNANKLYLAVKPEKYEFEDLFDDSFEIGTLPIHIESGNNK